MVDSSREGFERWVSTHGESWLTRDKDGILYRSNVAQWQWEAWQASRSAAIEECDQALITAGELQARWALKVLKGEG